MNHGLIIRAFREMWPVTLGLAVALCAFEGLLGYVLPTLHEQLSAQMLQLKFLQRIFSAMLGAEVSGNLIGPDLFMSICWVHPVPLALVWAHAIVCCTRVPAGEVDRGTIDMLLGLPVSRWEVFFSESLVWIGGGAALMVMALLGNVLGGLGVEAEFRAPIGRLLIVIVNLLCLYAAVGGIAWLISSLSDRRGWAITIVFVIVLGFFLLNFLAQFWKPAERVSFLSILRYYRPLFILRDGHWPWRDMLILLGAAAACWTAGGVIFARRDLSTV